MLFLLLSMVSMTMIADDKLNEKQSAFRLEILKTLGKEGFNPDYDKDGDVKFTYEDVTYYVSIDNRWTDPFLITIYNDFIYSGDYSSEVLNNCISLVGQSKTVRLFCRNSSYMYQTEMFCSNTAIFKSVFKKVLEQLTMARAEVVNIVRTGIGDLNMTTQRDEIFERGKKFYEEEDYDRSFTIFKLLSNAGYTPSYRYMGESYEKGAGTITNSGKMVQYYEKAVEEGDHWCSFKLANYYYSQEDYTKAYNMFLKCASNENENKSKAMYMVGNMQENGRGTEKSLTQAIQSYRKSVQYSTELECDARLALMNLGQQVEKPEDFVDASKTMLMDFSSPAQMYNAGLEYEQGLNKRFVSLPKAYALFKAAADRDYAKAFVKMGEIYRSKYYPLNDKAKSDKYYQKAFKVFSPKAENDGEAAYEIANMYQNGLGTSSDSEKAKYFFKRGAIMNNTNASYEHALICVSDLEYTDAFKYFKQAAETGHTLAMFNVAKQYEEGIGTEMNKPKAIEWYTKCAEKKSSVYDDARKALKRLGAIEEKN